MQIVFCHDVPYAQEIEYAFAILSSSIDCDLVSREISGICDDGAIIVSYGTKIPSNIHKNHLHIFADSSFWNNFGKRESLPKEPIYRFALENLQLRCNERLEDPFVCPYFCEDNESKAIYWQKFEAQRRAIFVCKVDLIASTFFWISRYEEIFAQDRDEFGRVPEEQFICVREDCYSRPLVDEYAEALFQLLSQLGVPLYRKQEPFRVIVTHDVDSGIPVKGGLEYFEYGLRSLYRETFRECRFSAGLRDCSQWFAVGLGMRSYAHVFREIVKLDQTYGFTSYFFLMANGTHPKDSQSDIFSEYSRQVIHEIKSSGGQIGLHLGINAHQSLTQFKKEWSNFREAVPGVLSASRSHYLVFRVPNTWRLLSELGCRVDSTLGFANHVGFRAGTSRPFKPFDVITQRVIPLWEYPMIIMDINLFAMRVRSDQERIEKALEVVHKTAAHGGCFVINWHNMHFFADYLRMYREILDYLSKRAKDVRLEAAPEPEKQVIW